MNLRVDELAFYDALADNPTAEKVLGDVTLKQIAHELVDSVRKNTSIDWQLKESVQAKLRVMVKRILRKYKYPPDDLRPANTPYPSPRFSIRLNCWQIFGRRTNSGSKRISSRKGITMARDKAYYEAEKKIEEARRSGAKELGISTLGQSIQLSELPDLIGNLAQLEFIN